MYEKSILFLAIHKQNKTKLLVSFEALPNMADDNDNFVSGEEGIETLDSPLERVSIIKKKKG